MKGTVLEVSGSQVRTGEERVFVRTLSLHLTGEQCRWLPRALAAGC
jgi:hypothetical protein